MIKITNKRLITSDLWFYQIHQKDYLFVQLYLMSIFIKINEI